MALSLGKQADCSLAKMAGCSLVKDGCKRRANQVPKHWLVKPLSLNRIFYLGNKD